METGLNDGSLQRQSELGQLMSHEKLKNYQKNHKNVPKNHKKIQTEK